MGKIKTYGVALGSFAVALALAVLAGPSSAALGLRAPQDPTCNVEEGMVLLSIPVAGPIGGPKVPNPAVAGSSRKVQYFGKGSYQIDVDLENNGTFDSSFIAAIVPFNGDAGEIQRPFVIIRQDNAVFFNDNPGGGPTVALTTHSHAILTQVNGITNTDFSFTALVAPAGIPAGGVTNEDDVITVNGPLPLFAVFNGVNAILGLNIQSRVVGPAGGTVCSDGTTFPAKCFISGE